MPVAKVTITNNHIEIEYTRAHVDPAMCSHPRPELIHSLWVCRDCGEVTDREDA